MLRRPKPTAANQRAPVADAATGVRSPIQLVLALGNPGSAYARHRHNVGVWALHRLGKQLGVELSRRSGVVELGEGELDGRRVVLARSRTFMNDSGKAAQQALKAYGLQPEQMLVVCDDLDRPVASLRLRPSGGHGGHNGLRSLVALVGSQAFARARIGIGRPLVGGEPTWEPEHIAAHVLAAPGPAERALLEEAAERAAEAIELALRDGIEAAMARYNASGPAPARA